ncbi:transposase [Fimbriiglobus ruber]|uniref:transposase n=1 Tax=Fimbriiglobus ruber TaxID=1908690 RepID=UPI003B845710
MLHPWLERERTAILAALPPLLPTADPSRAAWERWLRGLQQPITLPVVLPPRRVLLVLDNLAGHKSVALVMWLFAHGIMPLYTPVSGSWLNMAESIQRVLKTHIPHPWNRVGGDRITRSWHPRSFRQRVREAEDERADAV